MKKSVLSILVFSSVFAILTLNGCGGVDKVSPPAPSSTTVSGVAASGAPVVGTVILKDSSVPAKVQTTTTAADGSFSMDVSKLQAPFVLRVEWTQGGTVQQMQSFSAQNMRANINPLSNAAVAGAAEVDDPAVLVDHPDPAQFQTTARNLRTVIHNLQAMLAPLFQLYNTSKDPVSDDFEADHTGMDALFDDVRIKLASGTVVVTNKFNGLVIFSAPVNDLASGTFYPQNMPGVPGQVDGAALYASNCGGCHGALATSSKKGATAAMIQSAIKSNAGGMGSLASLTALQIQAIASVLGTGTTPPPPTPIDGAALYASDCSGCHGALATSSKQGRTAAQIQSAISSVSGMRSLSTLTADQIAAIAAALAVTTPPPAGCTYTYNIWGACQSNNTQTRTVATSSPAGCVGTPALTQPCIYVPPVTACTSFTYSVWGACQSNNTQTRTQLTALPAGCTGGTPVLSQACTYVPPVTACTSFTYSVWGACQSNNTQTRTQLTALPAGCTGGTPVLSQSCTYTPPVLDGAALYSSNCSGCHGALATSSKKGRTAAQITSAISGNAGGMGSLSALTSAQIAAIASALATTPPAACTSFTYSVWGACQSNNTQTRTQLTALPAGCTGGTPVLSQACTYVPPVTACTSFTYSVWGACQSNNTQTRTQLTALPAGCTGGTPVLSQACTYTPPPTTLTLAQVTATCTRCHGLTVNTTVLKSGGYNVQGRTASAWLSAITGMGATPAPGTTLQDYANFLAVLP